MCCSRARLADETLHRRLTDDAGGIRDADGAGAADRHGGAGSGQDAVPLGDRRVRSADAAAVHGQLAEGRVGDRERSAEVFREHEGEMFCP